MTNLLPKRVKIISIDGSAEHPQLEIGKVYEVTKWEKSVPYVQVEESVVSVEQLFQPCCHHKTDKKFLNDNAEFMFTTLIAFSGNPSGLEVTKEARQEIMEFREEAQHAGIDVIAISKGADMTYVPKPILLSPQDFVPGLTLDKLEDIFNQAENSPVDDHYPNLRPNLRGIQAVADAVLKSVEELAGI